MALAVLAIWLLSLLAPMHHISRLLGDLARAGVVTVSDWSLCVPLHPEGDRPDRAVKICPAQGIGKSGLALPPLAVLTLALRPAVAQVAFAPAPQRFWSRIRADTGQPRAPPRRA